MFLFFVSTLFLILFLILTLNLFKEFKITEKILTIFLLCCSYLVFTLELAGIFNALNNQIFILFLQALIVAATLFLNSSFKLGFPPLINIYFKKRLLKVLDLIRHNIGTSIFCFLILCIYIFLAYLQVRFPQNTTDSLLNHLSRIGHWLQQGSLKPYTGFNNIGSTFPIINSLLMFWSVVFLRSDKLVGYVQFVAALMLSISIYAMGREFGYSRRSSFLASLFFLTFPIVLFESITAQNDLLAACFLIIAFYFLIRFIHRSDVKVLALSILSFSLSVGTKQYALFALPGYAALFIFMLLKLRSDFRITLLRSSIYAICFIVFFSSYSYVQNWIYFGNPIGDKNSIALNIDRSQNKDLINKIAVNSLRLSYQFLSCEGFPPLIETTCINSKTKFFTPILASSFINLESNKFLFDKSEPFRLDTKYNLNEESSWFGIVGCLLILIAIPYGLITSIKKRQIEGIILIVSSIIFFLIVSSVKAGWDPYVGRYLLFSIVLILPFSVGFLDNKKKINNIYLWLVCTTSVFIMTFSVLNNDSRPLISQYQFLELQRWGKDHSLLTQKIAYKITPFVRNDLDLLDFWNATDSYVKTFSNQNYRIPLDLVDNYLVGNSTLGLLNPPGYEFPDYLFFGDSFKRKLVVFIDPEEIQSDHPKIDYLLISPDFYEYKLVGYQLIVERNNWRLYRNTDGN